MDTVQSEKKRKEERETQALCDYVETFSISAQ